MLIIGCIVTCLVVVAVAAILSALRASLYPSPTAMPAIVNASMPTLLARLESVLQERAPGVLSSLQPGLTDQAISALEAQGGLALTDELKALYQWRNGSPISARRDFIPVHKFLPLDHAIAQRAAIRSQRGASFVQRVVFGAFAAHRTDWLTVFDDGSGDGYFFDPDRPTAGGSFFYCFAEDSTYLFFPSVRNFLAGIIECFEKGAYHIKPDGSLDEDFNSSHTIWSKYAAAPPR